LKQERKEVPDFLHTYFEEDFSPYNKGRK